MGRPISRLSDAGRLAPKDKFLISEFNLCSDTLFYQKNVNFGTLEDELSVCTDISSLRGQNLLNQNDTIYEIRPRKTYVEGEISDFHGKFDENDALTWKIPEISDDLEWISQYIDNDILSVDEIYYPKRDSTAKWQLKLFAKNYIPSTTPLLKLHIPELKEGLSRHLYLILNCNVNTRIFFTSSVPQSFHSDAKIDNLVPVGTYIFDIKEFSQNNFFISRHDQTYSFKGLRQDQWLSDMEYVSP